MKYISWLHDTVSEWWQPKWITAILDSEDAHEEAVHAKHNTSPDNTGNLLRSGVFHTRNLQAQRDSGKGQDSVCKIYQLRLTIWIANTYTWLPRSASPCRTDFGSLRQNKQFCPCFQSHMAPS